MNTMTTEPDIERLRGWLTGRLPADWFDGAPRLHVDRDEIVVVGQLPSPIAGSGDATAEVSDAERAATRAGAARRFREDTREARIRIARELEHRTGRKVSWAVVVDDEEFRFTTASVPVMTRLRQPERQVLDTLVDAGVARSRSEALAWCVKLVGTNSEEWLGRLREALRSVEDVRAQGPA
jgi:hypothetical protein